MPTRRVRFAFVVLRQVWVLSRILIMKISVSLTVLLNERIKLRYLHTYHGLMAMKYLFRSRRLAISRNTVAIRGVIPQTQVSS